MEETAVSAIWKSVCQIAEKEVSDIVMDSVGGVNVPYNTHCRT